VASSKSTGPLVRSSYRADRVFEKNNVGLDGE
jgi:lipoate synthase